MAVVLVVDDNAENRSLVTTLLGYRGHATLEAADGAEGLALVVLHRPALVISDILMPSMDGFEFVRQLRADPLLAGTAVVFYTANYHIQDARRLAAACGVEHVLMKPCEPEEILRTVDTALAGGPPAPSAAAPATQPVDDTFDREHLRLVTDTLSRKADELQALNVRLAALTELNLQLASERNPYTLLDRVCRGARYLLRAKFGVLAIRARESNAAPFVTTSGLAPDQARMLGTAGFEHGIVGRVSRTRAPQRARGSLTAGDLGLPPGCPAMSSVAIAPVQSLKQAYGWLLLGDKLGAEEFSADDERALNILAAQVGRIYENGSLYAQLEQHAERLQTEIAERRRAAEDLAASEERFRQLAETIQDAFFIASPGFRRFLYVSPAYEQIWQRRRADVLANSNAWLESVHPDDRPRVGGLFARETLGDDWRDIEYRIVRPDGSVRWINARTFPVADTDGRTARMVGVATDITVRKQAEDRVRHLARVHAVLSGINSLIVRVQQRDELFREACRLAVEHGRFRRTWVGWFDAAARELVPVACAGDADDPARLPRERLGPDSDPVRDTPAVGVLRAGRAYVCNDIGTEMRLPDRESLLAQGHRSLIVLPLTMGGLPVGCLVLASDERDFFDEAELRLLTELAGDISFALDHIAKSERLNYLAYYDALTGLANRTLFLERVAQQISAAVHGGRNFALILADPERIERVNETLGRHVGDQLLRQMADRFVECVGSAKEVGRIAGDRFAALIPDGGDAGDVARTVERWWRQWSAAPFLVQDHELRIGARAGIALYPNDGRDPETLVRNAEAALRNAKSTGDLHQFYAPHLTERVAGKLALESELRIALELEEFVLFYQPKVDTESRRLEGVEALLRWQSRSHGLVTPATFIPLLEETGMIADVGAWVLRRASLDRSAWIERGLRPPRVAINVSTVQLRRQEFVRTFANVLRLAGTDPGIDIEVTESLIMQDVAANIEKLKEIRELGVGIAVDDFGTGYSSLAYLARLPINTLKIDGSFTRTMLDDPATMTLVSTIISLAHSLKLTVVAEGVESEEQAKILRLLRCDQLQGYLISHPLPVDEMTQRLARGRA